MRRVPDFSTRTKSQRAPWTERMLLVCSLAGAGASLWGAWEAKAAFEEAQSRSAKERRSLPPLKTRLGRFRSAAPATRKLEAQAALTLTAAPPRVVAELAALVPAAAKLDGLELSYGPQLELRLRVSARSAAAYDEFLRRLTAAHHIGEVVPGPETREGEVKGLVRAVYRPEDRP